MIDLTKTARASLMRDLTVADLRRFWSLDSRVRVEHVNQLLLFVIDNVFALRVKKFDDGSCSRNYSTEQDRDFRAQVELPGIEQTHHLEIGYVLDAATETEIEDVRVAYLNGDDVYWWDSLEKPSNTAYDLFQNVRDPNNPKPRLVPNDGNAVKITPKRK